jgi:hypothetical protein
MGLSPLPPLGMDDLGIGTGTTLGASSNATAPASSSPSLSGLAQGISSTGQSLINKYGSKVAGAGVSALASLFGLNAQAITVLIGLILIAGGIFLFKPVQQVIVGGAKKAGKAAAEAAIL